MAEKENVNGFVPFASELIPGGSIPLGESKYEVRDWRGNISADPVFIELTVGKPGS